MTEPTINPDSHPNPLRREILLLFAGILGLLILLFYGIFSMVSQNERPTGSSTARVLSHGMDAPDFNLPAQDGRDFHLANYRGRAVFLVFVPTFDDASSLAMLRSLKATTGDYDRAGAKVLVVSPQEASVAKSVYQSEKLPFPLLSDFGGALQKQYTVPEGRRTTFVVNPKGRVEFRIGDAMMEVERHGKQLLEISKCCMDDIVAARAGGIGKAVGDFSLPRADSGAMETLYGANNQKATVVAFLSVKCPCSNEYNDRIRELAEKYTAQGVRFIGVYSNSDESSAEIAKHAAEHNLSFPVLRDERGLCADHFRATVTPQVFVLDGENILRYGGRIDDNRNPAEVKLHDLSQALEATLHGGSFPEETRPFGCSMVRETTL